MYSVKVETRFSSSHFLREYAGKCASLHGHNWRVIVEIRGPEVNRTGMLVDFTEMQSRMDAIAEEFDHTVLNNHHYFKSGNVNPTAENIAYYFFLQLKSHFHPNRIHRIEVFETNEYVAAFLPNENK